MNVLSCFDGLSCGQIALRQLGLTERDYTYFASEIDKYCIQITQKNYPETIQLGDIINVNPFDFIGSFGSTIFNNIFLLLGGSPCQGFSYSGKGLNFQDSRSKLFFEFVRVLDQFNPEYFLFENVMMKKEYQDIITQYLDVEPICIDSSKLSGQSRKRLYWTNIPGVGQPVDHGICFTDISEDGWYPGACRGRRINPDTSSRNDYDKSIPIQQYIESRKNNKSNCLTTVAKDNVATPILHDERVLSTEVEYRYLTSAEYERLQTVPQGYTEGVSDHQRQKMLGNGWTVDVIAHILSYLL